MKSITKDYAWNGTNRYILKHNNRNIMPDGTNEDETTARQWAAMDEESRMHWIEEHRPNADLMVYKDWKARKQREWEEAHWQYGKKDDKGPEHFIQGLPAEGEEYTRVLDKKQQWADIQKSQDERRAPVQENDPTMGQGQNQFHKSTDGTR